MFNDVNIKPRDLVQIPLPNKWLNVQSELAEMVTHNQKLYAARANAKTQQQQAVLERQIAATDRRIDELVYELYELTDEEIRIVEEATAPAREEAVDVAAAEGA